MSAVIVDSNVLLDIFTEDSRWLSWSSNALERIANESRIVINPVIYGEVSIRFERIEDLDEALPPAIFEREDIPYEAAFLAGKAYLAYRGRAGTRSSLLPDFYVGAHAAIRGYRVVTRDVARYRTYFPKLGLIAP
ncbi:MAG TPA: type II toxin-antitoxin system VapC family toxin [Reyranella sp.]|jgi:predicted nucleic acid-binding protein|nr:type II toxin-antitoxin system VapC family toxin [Reyranella sp.]